jgi:hypothetical protein
LSLYQVRERGPELSVQRRVRVGCPLQSLGCCGRFGGSTELDAGSGGEYGHPAVGTKGVSNVGEPRVGRQRPRAGGGPLRPEANRFG